MYALFLFSMVLLIFTLIPKLYYGFKNSNKHVFSSICLLIGIILLISSLSVSNHKIAETMPDENMVNTCHIDASSMGFESDYAKNREIANYIIECGETLDFIEITENNGVYILNIVATGPDKTFVLHHWELYNMLPYLTFDNIPNVE